MQTKILFSNTTQQCLWLYEMPYLAAYNKYYQHNANELFNRLGSCLFYRESERTFIVYSDETFSVSSICTNTTFLNEYPAGKPSTKLQERPKCLPWILFFIKTSVVCFGKRENANQAFFVQRQSVTFILFIVILCKVFSFSK